MYLFLLLGINSDRCTRVQLTYSQINNTAFMKDAQIAQTIIYCISIPVSYTHLDVYKRQGWKLSSPEPSDH